MKKIFYRIINFLPFSRRKILTKGPFPNKSLDNIDLFAYFWSSFREFKSRALNTLYEFSSNKLFEKKLGEFFEPITLKKISEIGMKYHLPKINEKS